MFPRIAPASYVRRFVEAAESGPGSPVAGKDDP
jgi:hypothetical protein